MRYDFELLLKSLKFFNLHGVMPPSNFSLKLDNWLGGMTPRNTIIKTYVLSQILIFIIFLFF